MQNQLEYTESIIQIGEFINKFNDFPFIPFPEELTDFTNNTGKIDDDDADEHIKNFYNFVNKYYEFEKGSPVWNHYYNSNSKHPKWLLKQQDSSNRCSLDKMQDPKYSEYIKDILEAKKN